MKIFEEGEFMSCWMGIDVGTSGIKVIIIDENGSVLGEGYAEQDVILLGGRICGAESSGLEGFL